MAKGKKKNKAKKATDKLLDVPVKKVPKKSALPDLVLQPNFWRNNWLPAVLLFALAIALYFQSINFTYVLDDQIVFTKNEYVKKGFAGIGDIMGKETFQGYFGEQKNLIEGGRYRPLSLVTFAIEHQFFGLNSRVSHFINILLYALTALLLYRVLCMILPARNQWFFSIAFIATLLYVAHPIHTEVVANVKGRDEILTLMGALATMYFSLRYIATEKIYHIILSCIFFFLGLLAKENALTFLAVIPATAYCFTNASWKKILMITAPLLVVAILYIVLRLEVIGFLLSRGKPVTDLMNNPFVEMNVSEKFATIFFTLGRYVKLLFFPHPLTHDYYPYQIPIMQWTDWQSILSLLGYIAMGVYAVYGLLKKHLVAYGIFFYLATLSIVSNVPFTVGTFMNERFVYVSSIGFCLILAYWLCKVLPEKMGKTGQMIGMGIAGIFLAGYIVKTVLRVPAWENALSLNKAAIKYSSESARANCFMGTALFEEYRDPNIDPKLKEELLEQITFHLNKSLSIYPRYGSALIMQSGIVAEHYKKDRDLDKLLDNFYKLLEKKRNLPFIEEYMDYLIDRADADKLAAFCYKTGYELFGRKVRDGNYAIKYLNYGLKAAPNNARLNYGIGKTYEAMGKSDKAQTYLDRAYKLDPSLPN